MVDAVAQAVKHPAAEEGDQADEEIEEGLWLCHFDNRDSVLEQYKQLLID